MLNGEITKVIGDMMGSNRVKKLVSLMGRGGSCIGIEFNMQIINNFKARTGSVTSFITPLTDIIFIFAGIMR